MEFLGKPMEREQTNLMPGSHKQTSKNSAMQFVKKSQYHTNPFQCRQFLLGSDFIFLVYAPHKHATIPHTSKMNLLCKVSNHIASLSFSGDNSGVIILPLIHAIPELSLTS